MTDVVWCHFGLLPEAEFQWLVFMIFFEGVGVTLRQAKNNCPHSKTRRKVIIRILWGKLFMKLDIIRSAHAQRDWNGQFLSLIFFEWNRVFEKKVKKTRVFWRFWFFITKFYFHQQIEKFQKCQKHLRDVLGWLGAQIHAGAHKFPPQMSPTSKMKKNTVWKYSSRFENIAWEVHSTKIPRNILAGGTQLIRWRFWTFQILIITLRLVLRCGQLF